MAKEAEKNTKKRVRKPETVRDRTTKAAKSESKPKRLRKVGTTAAKPFQRASAFGKKEIQLPLTHKIPDTKVGRFFSKRRSATPRYFINAFKELKQVRWPSNRETLKLTSAVFIFAVIFGLLVAIVDYILDYIFKKVIL